jgi:hypothetical protein
VCSLIGCATDEFVEAGDEEIADEAMTEETESEASCTPSSSVYVPFTGTSSTGAASQYPWQGHATSYPAALEDFRGYALPLTVECSSSKSTRSHLDVTSGCLTAVSVGAYSRGQITSTSSGAFRVVALPFTGSETNPLKWTDMSNEFRFYYKGTSGAGVDPGFKAFVRYRSENDLYVASWRMDGYLNIKKKHCGTYTTLAQKRLAAPTTGTWHRMRFDAIGNRLVLYVDGVEQLSATDSTFSWGTAGIRTDAMTGAYLDDWTVR